MFLGRNGEPTMNLKDNASTEMLGLLFSTKHLTFSAGPFHRAESLLPPTKSAFKFPNA